MSKKGHRPLIPHLLVKPCGNGNKGIVLKEDKAARILGYLQQGKFPPFPATKRRPVTPHFTVFTDNVLGKKATKLAQGVLAQCEADYNRLVEIFGAPQPHHFRVFVTDTNFGEHANCTSSDICCGSSETNVGYTHRLLVMEEVEVFEALQNRGWKCRTCMGEALSRVLAEQFHPPQGENLISSPCWLDGEQERPDRVTNNDCTDVDLESVGCAVLFLYYLHFQLRFSWPEIVQAGGETLAEVYKKLTGKNDAFQSFNKLIEAHFPKGKPSGLTRDNPFPLPPVKKSADMVIVTSEIEIDAITRQ